MKALNSCLNMNRIGSISSCFRVLKKHCSFLFLSATFLIVGCGGGSDGDGATSGGGIAPGPSAGGSLNRGLTGRIITTQDGFPFEFDLRTGRSEIIVLDDLQLSLVAAGESIGVGDGFFFTGTLNGNYVHSGNECFEPESDFVFNDDSCYVLFNENLSRIDFVRLRNVETDGPVRLSESGRFMAYSESFETVDNGHRSNTIIQDAVTRENVQVFRRPEPSLQIRSPVFVWGENGEFIFTGVGDNEVSFIEISNENNFDQSSVITFPNTALFQNSITAIDLNSAGDRLVFVIDGTVQILDLNTLSITQPVTKQFGNFRQARWSPDGSMIMVMRQSATPPPLINFDSTVSVIPNPSREQLYAVSADVTEPVDVDGDSLDGIVIIQSERLGRPGSFTTSYPGDAVFVIPTYDWLAE